MDNELRAEIAEIKRMLAKLVGDTQPAVTQGSYRARAQEAIARHEALKARRESRKCQK